MRPNCLMLSGFYCRGCSEGLFHAWLGNISAQWQPFTLPVTHTLADPNRGPVGEESFKRQCFLLLVSGRPSHVLDSLVGHHIWWAGNLGQLGSSVATTIQHFNCALKWFLLYICLLMCFHANTKCFNVTLSSASYSLTPTSAFLNTSIHCLSPGHVSLAFLDHLLNI